MTDAELDRLVTEVRTRTGYHADAATQYLHELDRAIARAAYEAGLNVVNKASQELVANVRIVDLAKREGRLEALKDVLDKHWNGGPTREHPTFGDWLESEIAKLEKADE